MWGEKKGEKKDVLNIRPPPPPVPLPPPPLRSGKRPNKLSDVLFCFVASPTSHPPTSLQTLIFRVWPEAGEQHKKQLNMSWIPLLWVGQWGQGPQHLCCVSVQLRFFFFFSHSQKNGASQAAARVPPAPRMMLINMDEASSLFIAFIFTLTLAQRRVW